MTIKSTVRSVMFALIGLACMSQLADAKKPGSKEFTAQKVENDSMSVGVTRVTLKPNGNMAFTLLVQSKSDRSLNVDMKGFVLAAGGHEYQRDSKIIGFSSQKIEKNKPATIKIEFNGVDTGISEAALKMSAVFRLKSDKKDQAIGDLALTIRGGASGGSNAGGAGSSGDSGGAPSDDGSSGQ